MSWVAQSAGEIDILRSFNVNVFNIAAPARRGQANKLTREDVTKRSILQLRNDDNLCFLRSLMLPQIHRERGNLRMGELHERWNAVRCRTSALRIRVGINTECRCHDTRGGLRNSRNRAFPTVSRCRKYRDYIILILSVAARNHCTTDASCLSR